MSSSPDQRPPYILPVIVFAQFSGTSLWFAGNAVMADLRQTFDLPPSALGHLTAAVQLGFIAGTLLFAFLMIADRFSPSRVFLACALAGAAANLAVAWLANDFLGILILRFFTGVFLAGIYPVGMKISADWYAKGLGKALGYLVGALVLGTAFPHLLRYQAGEVDWRLVMTITSAVAAAGGIILWLLVPDGPNRKPGRHFNPRAIGEIFSHRRFRAAAFGYFGHMWELYAFWAFVPLILLFYFQRHELGSQPLSLLSFGVIAAGSLGCVLGGYISLQKGSAPVAIGMMVVSGTCCLLLPWAISWSWPYFLGYLLLWGFAVVGDSPQFSTLAAGAAPGQYVGSALTIMNTIGFAITIGSIQLLNHLNLSYSPVWIFWLLAPGPLLGIIALLQTRNPEQRKR